MHETAPRPTERVLWREIDGDITIYQPEGNSVHVLNHTAGAIWKKLDGRRSIAEIAAAVSQEFDEDPTTIQDDVARVIDLFSDGGLLVGSRSSGPRTSVMFDLAGVLMKLSAEAGSPAERLCELLPAIPDGANGPDRADHDYVVRPASEAGKWDLILDGDMLIEGRDLHLVEKKLVNDLNRAVSHNDQALSVHSGAVAIGETVVSFPGESGHGKSTIVAACVKRGFGYVTDEALLVDYESGAVVPFQKPIQLDAASLSMLGASVKDGLADGADAYLSAAALGGKPVPPASPLRLGHVVLLSRGSRSDPPELVPLPRSQIVVALLRGAFNHYRAPERAFELVFRLAEEALVWELRLGDPLEAAELLRDRLSGMPVA